MFFLVFSFITIQVFFSCNKKDEIIDKLKKENIVINKSIENIFILTDSGCSSCNKKFSEIIDNNIEDKKSIIIINSNGFLYDISRFLEKNNVFIIKSFEPVFNETTMYKVKNMQVYEKTVINADNVSNIKT